MDNITEAYGVGNSPTKAGETKVVNIGAGGEPGSNTIVNIGSANGGETVLFLHGSVVTPSDSPLPILDGGTGNTTGTATINANLTGPITSAGNTTSVASQTGTGSKFVMDTSPTLVTPNLGTPTALVGTNITGTAAALSIGGTAATVTTNANLTGPITSSGNATSVASQTGTGSTFVMNTSPTLVTPALGTPTALVGTNITGTASALSIGGNAATATTATNVFGSGSVVADSVSAATIVGGAVSGSSVTSISGAITPAYPAGIIGNTTGSAVTAGSVGQIITDGAANVSLTGGTAASVKSITLTAGTWIVFANAIFNYSGAASSGLAIAINDVAVFPGTPLYSFFQFATGVTQGLVAPTIVVNNSTTKTYYLMVQANYTGGSMTADGMITAVRVG